MSGPGIQPGVAPLTLMGLATGLGSGAGARTLLIAKVGDRVNVAVRSDNGSGTDLSADFESTITVDGQIQQTAASLTGQVALVTLRRG